MPHCVIEYTRDIEKKIDISELLETAFDAVLTSGHFDRASIKARAIGFDIFKSGQSRDDYIHVKLRILSGRTADEKKFLSDHLIAAIGPHIGNTKSLTVEIIDMDRGSYGKLIAPD
ncbi:MAG: 5-carboxymethyl-2-hydroxymuconate Delta-isomerase [Alphaproteobacteria bacterium]|nr:5-carboxymethyl-2-hydroxymuconate Delta-isomerase [Alphaproteobacteria bacterium]HRW29938.1 5-carboxymethyl-2-hydroxymuconate Delta-isomerase [Emcibacteraceae bacterium]